MRDEMNRNTYTDLVQKQYEKMDPVDPMTDIPDNELQSVGENTSQSLTTEETTVSSNDQRVRIDYEGSSGLEAERTGKLPLDHVPADTSYTLGKDANETYPRRDPGMLNQTTENYKPEVMSSPSDNVATDDPPLEDVPDADEFHAGSPVDPATPEGLDQHGIDLLNGVGGVDDETDRKLPEDF